MFEVEMKFRIDDPEAFENRLREFGVVLGPEVEEIDRFYQHPSRDFAKTDEGLRIRSRYFADGSEERFLTYKGPKIDPLTKTRREIEIPLGPDQPWDDVLRALGFEPRQIVRKFRRHGEWVRDGRNFNLVSDRLPDLQHRGEPGTFAELETIAEENGLEQARAAILRLASDLRLSDSVRTGYLEILFPGSRNSR